MAMIRSLVMNDLYIFLTLAWAINWAEPEQLAIVDIAPNHTCIVVFYVNR